jgi:Cu-Zn family superoxide dismutase
MPSLIWLIVGVGAALLAGCAGGAVPAPPPQATAQLTNASGQVVGNARFWDEGSGGVRLLVQAEHLSPGAHGIHLHAVGKCDPPEFTSSGGHFNPTGKSHGLQNPAGPHAGDLPNLIIGSDGRGTLEYTDRLVTVGPGPNSIVGTAVVIHAGPDDQKTDPAGNSGARIACGVVQTP